MRRLPACSFLFIIGPVLLFGNLLFAVPSLWVKTRQSCRMHQAQLRRNRAFRHRTARTKQESHFVDHPKYRSDENPGEIKR